MAGPAARTVVHMLREKKSDLARPVESEDRVRLAAWPGEMVLWWCPSNQWHARVRCAEPGTSGFLSVRHMPISHFSFRVCPRKSGICDAHSREGIPGRARLATARDQSGRRRPVEVAKRQEREKQDKTTRNTTENGP